MEKALRQGEAELRLAVAIRKLKGTVDDRGGISTTAIAPCPLSLPQDLFLFWRRGGSAIRCLSNIRSEKLRLQKWCQKWRGDRPMPSAQCPVPKK